MSTMTQSNEKARETLARLVERAVSTDVEDGALSHESPLSVEVSGKYVNVLFSTGGPHTEITAEFADAEDAEYWFENEPRGAWVTFMDWGTREDVYTGPREAGAILQAITRDPEELEEEGEDN